MSETDGINFGLPYDAERDGIRFKPQYHRPGQTYRQEGFRVTVNKQDPVRGTDWTPRNRGTTVKTTAAAGTTVISVNSVYYFAKYRQVTFDRGGAGEEAHYITDIDVANKTITLQEGLTNEQAAGKTVDMDMITVTNPDGRTTYIDMVIGGQHATLPGIDLQKARVRPPKSHDWAKDDRLDGFIRVPIALNTYVNAVVFCDECYEAEGGEDDAHDSKESASAIDPNYLLRVVFTSAEATPTEKDLTFSLGTWRVI